MTDNVPPETADPSGSRKRKYERHSRRLRLRCRRFRAAGLYAADETYVEGCIRNQSKGEFLLETPICFPENSKLEAAFHSPDDRQSFIGVVTIRWIKRVGDCSHLGVSTDELEHF